MKKRRFPLPRLSRRGKIIRNLLLCLPLAVLAWTGSGCPMPTLELEFRQLEGQYLLPPSEILWNTQTEGDRDHGEREQDDLWWLTDDWVVAVRDNVATAARFDRSGTRQTSLECYPVEEELFAVPILDSNLLYEGRRVDGLAVFNIPESVRLNYVVLEHVGADGTVQTWEQRHLMRRVGRGIQGRLVAVDPWIFSGNWYEECRYTLYTRDGAWGGGAVPEAL